MESAPSRSPPADNNLMAALCPSAEIEPFTAIAPVWAVSDRSRPFNTSPARSSQSPDFAESLITSLKPVKDNRLLRSPNDPALSVDPIERSNSPPSATPLALTVPRQLKAPLPTSSANKPARCPVSKRDPPLARLMLPSLAVSLIWPPSVLIFALPIDGLRPETSITEPAIKSTLPLRAVKLTPPDGRSNRVPLSIASAVISRRAPKDSLLGALIAPGLCNFML